MDNEAYKEPIYLTTFDSSILHSLMHSSVLRLDFFSKKRDAFQIRNEMYMHDGFFSDFGKMDNVNVEDGALTCCSNLCICRGLHSDQDF
jgi:hypothetical protein